MARVKVVLREDVDKLGAVGEVVSVAGGYARNYLIPRGLAVPATSGNVKQAEHWKRSVASRERKELESAEQLRTTLESAPLQVTHQAGPDGRLFGSITSAEIAQRIRDVHGAEIDRHTIELPEPIRHLGFHEANVRLRSDVTARVTVEVVEA